MHPFRVAVEAQDIEAAMAVAEAMKAQLELAQRELGVER